MEKITFFPAMKLILALCIAAFFLTVPQIHAAEPLASTESNSLNNLIRRLPVFIRSEELRELSVIQEHLVLFERQMRGEGLPEPIATAFSVYYSSVISALIEERITEEYGRDLLSVHRQLLDRTHVWNAKLIRNESFGGEVVENLRYFLRELDEKAAPKVEVPPCVVTPVVNGYQVWVGELLAWGTHCCGLNPGQIRRISHNVAELERFEYYYKRDGYLNYRERELLHERFIDLTRETIDELRDVPLRAPGYYNRYLTARL